MKAMILAAGRGTRLQPITNTKPKALVEIKGVPLIEIAMNELLDIGISEVIINLHHFPTMIKKFFQSKNNFGVRVEFSEEEELLDTGGGLKKAAWFFDDGQPFFVHNVDVIHDIDLKKMLGQHRREGHLVTLAVNRRETQRYFIFDDQMQLCGWKSLEENKERLVRKPEGGSTDLAFCGIQVCSPAVFEKMTQEEIFSLVDFYLSLAENGEEVKAFEASDYSWRDVGKLEQLSF